MKDTDSLGLDMEPNEGQCEDETNDFDIETCLGKIVPHGAADDVYGTHLNHFD